MSSDRKKCWAAKAAAIGVMALVAGCATKPTTPTGPGAAAPPSPTVQVEAPLAPADYVREASSISLYAVRASQLVSTRNVGLTGIARTVEQEQGGIASQLSFAGRRVDLLPSATLLPEHQAMLTALESAADPAAAYRSQMRKLLSRGLRIHSAFAARGASPTLRPVASMAAPVFQRELRLFR